MWLLLKRKADSSDRYWHLSSRRSSISIRIVMVATKQNYNKKSDANPRKNACDNKNKLKLWQKTSHGQLQNPVSHNVLESSCFLSLVKP